MPDKPESNLQYWALLYNDFLAETEPPKLQILLVALEEAIFFRLQALDRKTSGWLETVALQTAVSNLQKIKTKKLRSPAA
jgi:hypothetical protein